MWKLGLRPRYSFSGNICFKFSAFCLCSAGYTGWRNRFLESMPGPLKRLQIRAQVPDQRVFPLNVLLNEQKGGGIPLPLLPTLRLHNYSIRSGQFFLSLRSDKFSPKKTIHASCQYHAIKKLYYVMLWAILIFIAYLYFVQYTACVVIYLIHILYNIQYILT